MSVFKSAMGYFSSGGANGSSDNDFVGQFVEIGNMKLRVKKVIAEGGFAFVFVAQDVSSGTEYALKRLMAADEQANKNIIQEISILKKLSGHPNIIKYIAASFIDKAKTSHGMGEYLLLTDLCSGGSLMEALQNRGQAFPPSTIVRVFYQTCKAVQHMHAQVPPIAHRDLKLENFLISNEGTIKLCDFGSATTETYTPNPSWSANQRNILEENLAQFTTPMYRAPEMLDTWDNHKIDHAVDIWALGCILYTLCHMQHPFEDSAKLAILNGNYNLNPNDQRYRCFHEMINGCLAVAPARRPGVGALLERVAAAAEALDVDLKRPLKFERKKVEQSVATSSPVCSQLSKFIDGERVRLYVPMSIETETPPKVRNAVSDKLWADRKVNNATVSTQEAAPPRPPEPARPPAARQSVARQPVTRTSVAPSPAPVSGGLFSSIKDGAGSFLKNLKDTSSKVMQTVQQSIARADLDISYITSRVMVMSYPSELLESAYRTNHIEDVRMYLESHHPGGQYCVFSVHEARARFPRRQLVTDAAVWPSEERAAPLLAPCYALLQRMYHHLAGGDRAALVVACQDGKSRSCMLLGGLLMYAKLVTVPEDALQIFAVKRTPVDLPPGQLRYLYYLSNIIRREPILPHFRPVSLVSITIQPVPLFTKARDGCRPYLEVYHEDRLISPPIRSYESMHLYTTAEGKVTLPVDSTVCGDVCVVVLHARQQLGRLQRVPMLSVAFHTGFLAYDQHAIKFTRSEIDGIDDSSPMNDHFSPNLSVVISLVVQNGERRKPRSDLWEDDHSYPIRTPDVLFSSNLERDETIDNFVTADSPPATKESPRPPRPAPPVVSPTAPRRPPPPVGPLAGPLAASPAGPPAGDTADLLNITEKPTGKDVPKLKNEDSFDFFGMLEKPSEFGDFLSSQEANNPQPFPSVSESIFADLPAPNAINANVNSSDPLNFDPFGLNDPIPEREPPLAPLVPEEAKPQSLPPDQDKRDPFAELGTSGAALPAATPHPTPRATPHQTPLPTPLTTPLVSPRASPAHQPDYSRTHFDAPKPPDERGRRTGDVFGDLLGSQGYDFAKRDPGPRTINAMRREETVKVMDPDRLKIHEWTEGKKANVRALLCSLHECVWSGCRWSRVDMAQLVTPADVKRHYRRACLAVHPDKQMGTPNENLARMIFMELNTAWSEFESDPRQRNPFGS